MSNLFRIGDRVINLHAVTLASFEPRACNPASKATWVELTLSFTQEDTCLTLYGSEAEQFWSLLCGQAMDITPEVQQAA